MDDFYVVTLDSVYHVHPEENHLTATKIAERIRGHAPLNSVIYAEAMLLPSSGLLAISKMASGAFFIAESTLPIVGLFLDRQKALACMASDVLVPDDPCWAEERKEVFAMTRGNDSLFPSGHILIYDPQPEDFQPLEGSDDVN
ncbi:MAG: hypothetical protein A2945_03690 [Candidatus Liptonbacteria bacterium RIFCSPLOWO2_01_FULL_52_25]|uniref:Uncharacterized protein n=1 Tax=Candidatus Liptonbacteria bacterium RIFCSPLOWO2_01_FULL_52_25 TaxID=1798650 RepID=A0A1G2CJ35_9BACT|nr:MAG: hypothetical protein A2945_03690 [Candidatus Liptonbacteria bacterium RIFCSPLOWO2_01_FULL_52_25]